MFWVAKAKKDYICDICKKVIKKGEKRICEGMKNLVYTFIDRNYHIECFKKEHFSEIQKMLNIEENNKKC